MNITEKKQHLAETLALIPDPQERLAAVVDQARKLAAFSPAERTDVHRVRGCVSQVYLIGEVRDGRCRFRADADSPLVRGLVALLCDFFSDLAPAEIAASDVDPLSELGLVKNLSPTRQNGLASVRAAIRAFAQSQLTA